MSFDSLIDHEHNFFESNSSPSKINQWIFNSIEEIASEWYKKLENEKGTQIIITIIYIYIYIYIYICIYITFFNYR